MAISEAVRPYWAVWLMILFVGIVVWAFWPRNKKRFEEASTIPLKDDD